MTKQGRFRQLQKTIASKHFFSLTFNYYPELNTVELEVIVVRTEHKRQGHASRAMRQICELCDEIGVLFVLYPSNEFGTSKAVLHKFYRGFGFRFQRKKDYFDRYKNFMKRNYKKKLKPVGEMGLEPELPTTAQEYKNSIEIHLLNERLNKQKDNGNENNING